MVQKYWIKTLLAVLVCAVAAPAMVSAACKKADRSISGLYQLNGVREVGSQIDIAPNGRFGYMFTVGAYDEFARGCWSRKGSTVTLVPTRMRTGPGGKKFKRLDLKLNASGNLVRIFPSKHVGRYVRIRKYPKNWRAPVRKKR